MSPHATAELLAIESQADDEISNLQLPHPARDISLWHILTVFEDSLRFAFTGLVDMDLIGTTILGDLSKYAMRHSLEHIFRRCDSHYGMSAPKKTIPDAYIRAFTFFKKCIDYSRISKLFTSLHVGHAVAKKVNGIYEIKYIAFIDKRYAALEMLDHGQEPGLDITAQLYAWFHDLRESPGVLGAIAESTKIKNKFVSYEYGPQAHGLQIEMNQRLDIIPSEWAFPWGSAYETHVLINSLLIRCTYHFLAVNLAARRSGFSGGAESSLVLAINKADLCRDISLFADIGDEKIATFVDYITYGFQAQTPDPALQPIIPTVDGILLVPCLHTITCDLQRNILSLMARIDADSFNKQSKLFEVGMTESLGEYLKKWPLTALNKKMKLGGQDQEFDVLLADASSKTLVIFELRWILQPGDPREIANKMKECKKKISKLEKKIAFCQKNLKEIFDLTFPDVSGDESFADWNVCGAVVIEGFGGILSEKPNLPIITSAVLKIGLSQIDNIAKLIEWIQSLTWLPQEGTHFKDEINEIEIGPNLIKYPGFSLLDAALHYRDHIEQSLTPFKDLGAPEELHKKPS